MKRPEGNVEGTYKTLEEALVAASISAKKDNGRVWLYEDGAKPIIIEDTTKGVN